ncbi:transporter substrate-binding domain-containing protein [Vibrio profundum]|uniref:substrate-binding periplasmic protein n=1 Tax=Vibrio profundum TaxID=2910247 RepID=UPI003D119659
MVIALTILLYANFTSASTILASCIEKTPPFCYQSEGKPQGFLVDILSEISKRMSVDIIITPLPAKRLLLNMKTGEIHIAMPIVFSKDRANHIHFLSSTVMTVRMGLYGFEKNRFNFQRIENLFGKTIAIRNGYYVSKAYTSAVEAGKIKVVVTKSDEQLIQLVSKERVKYVLMPNVSFAKYAASSEIVRYGVLGKPIGTKVGVSKQSWLYKDHHRVDDAFLDMIHDGTLANLEKKYGIH